MNLQDARTILELSPTATSEEAKKRYREFTKKYHPDVNKDPGAEDKFKKINEAYQVVSTGKSTDREDMHSQDNINPFNINFGNPFGRQTQIHSASNVDLYTTISFKESILGCKKEMKFNRNIKCNICNGNGQSTQNNGCDKCGGKGQVINRQGGMIIVQTCNKCHGVSKTISCTNCNSEGVMNSQSSIGVSIPAGIQDNNILRLSGMGHFVTSFGNLDQYTDAHLHVHVISESGLKLEGMDVVTTLEISLLEALSGSQKKVNTILGEKEIDIKPKSKNKEEVIIPLLGVNRTGNQRVILNIQYPEDVSDLINVLSNKEI